MPRRRPPKSAAKDDPAAVLARLQRCWSRGGKTGGPKGGKARWEGVSAVERSAIARRAAKARWARKAKGK